MDAKKKIVSRVYMVYSWPENNKLDSDEEIY
jgi:hypothetical protein